MSRRARPLLDALRNLEAGEATPRTVDSLLDALGSELADEGGFENDDTVNDYGRELEQLIGKIVRELRSPVAPV